jgi:type VI secretion system protein ImpM
MSTPGWYGKICSLGDFASRRLPAEWVGACDDWLAQCLLVSRQQLGPRWLNTYLSAPIWRFAWAPGVVDGAWWFGVLMPSCDNVGRYFPLVVAQAREQPPADGLALEHLEAWWTHVAGAALATLDEHVTAEAFDAQLAAAPHWPTPGLRAAQMRPAAGRQRFLAAHAASVGQALAAVAVQDMLARLSGASAWWRVGQDGQPAVFSVAQGLPAPTAYGELLSGTW